MEKGALGGMTSEMCPGGTERGSGKNSNPGAGERTKTCDQILNVSSVHSEARI